MKLNYKPIKEQVWPSAWLSIKNYISYYSYEYIFNSIDQTLYLSVFMPAYLSVKQTLEEHNEIKV